MPMPQEEIETIVNAAIEINSVRLGRDSLYMWWIKFYGESQFYWPTTKYTLQTLETVEKIDTLVKQVDAKVHELFITLLALTDDKDDNKDEVEN